MTVKKAYTPFQQAILDSVLEDYKKLMADAPEIAACPAGESRTEQTEKRRNLLPISKRIARAILVGAIIVVLLAATVMAIPALREIVVEFFLCETSDSYGITFDPEAAATAPARIEKIYAISYLPDDYTLHIDSATNSRVYVIWINPIGDRLTFAQSIISEWQRETHFSVDAGCSRETVIIGDHQVTIIYSSDYRELIWTDNAYCYVLEIPISVSQEEVEKIFASWGPKE